MLLEDSMILLSYLNTKLWDDYGSLAVLCEELDCDIQRITEKLRTIGYTYNEEQNRFLCAKQESAKESRI